MTDNYVIEFSNVDNKAIRVPYKSINTDTPITLIGKSCTSWGSHVNQNLLNLLENFADDTAPLNDVVGQLWFDSKNNKLMVKESADGYREVGYTRPPVIPLDAVLNAEVTSKLSNYLPITGGNMLGSLLLCDNIDSDLDETAATKKYVDSKIPQDHLYIPLSGNDLATGKLYLKNDQPTVNNQVVTVDYVDNTITQIEIREGLSLTSTSNAVQGTINIVRFTPSKLIHIFGTAYIGAESNIITINISNYIPLYGYNAQVNIIDIVDENITVDCAIITDNINSGEFKIIRHGHSVAVKAFYMITGFTS